MVSTPEKSSGMLLQGVRVVDLTRAFAGPSCTALMAALGAEVIKIEPPGGDFTRHHQHLKDGASGYFLQRNYGKKGLCVDLRKGAGRRIVEELASVSDVLVESYRPGVMQRLGLDFASLRGANPGIVVCSISGYGQYGPYKERAGADHAIQAATGLMWMAGESDGPPMWAGTAFTDSGAGVHAFGAICAALFRRERTGAGEWIDVSLYDCAFWQHEFAVQQYLLSDGAIKPKRMGNRRVGTSPSGVYRARDGYVALGVGTDGGWAQLAQAIGRPELAQDPRFRTEVDRWAHADEIDRLVEGWLMSRPSADEAVAVLADRFHLPCAKVMTVEEAVTAPQVRERGLLAEVSDPTLGHVMVQSAPVKFSSGTATPSASAPLLGEHTRPVLRDLLGYSRERVLKLLGEGVIEVDERVLPAVLAEGQGY